MRLLVTASYDATCLRGAHRDPQPGALSCAYTHAHSHADTPSCGGVFWGAGWFPGGGGVAVFAVPEPRSGCVAGSG